VFTEFEKSVAAIPEFKVLVCLLSITQYNTRGNTLVCGAVVEILSVVDGNAGE
jgi:hypothetical protein